MHGKEYGSTEEELMRHTVWESNKKYIDNHNEHADTLGFTLAMNEFGDLVIFHNQYNLFVCIIIIVLVLKIYCLDYYTIL